MRPGQHAAVSVGSGLVLGLFTRSWTAGVACCLAGVFIDLDHIFDFWLNRGFSLSPAEFFDFCYRGTSRRFYDLLHGYEFIPFYWWLSTLPGWGEAGLGILAGYSLHLLGDQFFNRHLHRWTYFFTYRLIHGFRYDSIVLYNPFVPAGRGGQEVGAPTSRPS